MNMKFLLTFTYTNLNSSLCSKIKNILRLLTYRHAKCIRIFVIYILLAFFQTTWLHFNVPQWRKVLIALVMV